VRGVNRVLPSDQTIATTPTDCLRCGVCCFSPSETYVRVTGEDWTRLGEAAERVAHFVGIRAYMRRSEGHCAALAVRRAAEGGTEYFCTVYARRPQVCRDLERGSPQCEGEIVTKGAEVEKLRDES
jgi:Fe-S-cluster containining protein